MYVGAYHIKYGRLSADVMLSQRMIRSVSSLETQRFNTWNAGFQYMERRVSVYETQGFNTWNAQSQAMKTLL